MVIFIQQQRMRTPLYASTQRLNIVVAEQKFLYFRGSGSHKATGLSVTKHCVSELQPCSELSSCTSAQNSAAARVSLSRSKRKVLQAEEYA